MKHLFVDITVLLAITWLSQQEIYTATIKLCHLLKLELDELAFITEKPIINETIEDEFNDLIEQIILEVNPEILKHMPYSLDDCINENNILNRFITNPINSLMIIKRFLYTWPLVRNLTNHKNEEISEFIEDYDFNENDIKGAYEAIYRLHEFYSLDPRDIITGELSAEFKLKSKNWAIVPKHLTQRDVVEIGIVAYDENDYQACISWMIIIYNDTKNNVSKTPDYILITALDYLAWAEHSQNNSEMARKYCSELIEIDPTNENWPKNLEIFSKPSENLENITEIDEPLEFSLHDQEKLKELQRRLNNYSDTSFGYYYDDVISRHICKYGDLFKNAMPNFSIPLCYNKMGSNLFGKFIKANIELIVLDPKIYILRSIASEEDIQYFIKLARHSLNTATVHNPRTGKLETAKYRITQSSWFHKNIDPVIKKMTAKVKVASGLTLESSEQLQIANYGIGGYYGTHYDFSRKDDPNRNDSFNVLNGKRVATYLLYMSDVEIGGRTGFPRLGISIKASKGDALFWHNLLLDQTGDARTRHIACPVGLGTKWVATFWIRCRGEEMTRPCGLTEQNGI